MICRNCGLPREDEQGKCWNCKADFHGHVPKKHAVQPRELMAKIAKYRCEHEVLRHLPCVKCGRLDDEDLDVYKRHIQVDLQAVFISFGASKSEAWKAAEIFLADHDARESPQDK